MIRIPLTGIAFASLTLAAPAIAFTNPNYPGSQLSLSLAGPS